MATYSLRASREPNSGTRRTWSSIRPKLPLPEAVVDRRERQRGRPRDGFGGEVRRDLEAEVLDVERAVAGLVLRRGLVRERLVPERAPRLAAHKQLFLGHRGPNRGAATLGRHLRIWGTWHPNRFSWVSTHSR